MLAADAVTPATQAVTFAVIGGLVTVLTLYLTNRSKRQTEERIRDQHDKDEQTRLTEKREDREASIAKEARDYARQDAVQARTEAVAAVALAKLTAVEDLGKVTHALVNSDKTAAMRDQRDSLYVTLMLMREVVSLKAAQGVPASEETINAIGALQNRLKNLDQSIEQRLNDQHAQEAANLRGADEPLRVVVDNLGDLPVTPMPPPPPPA